MAATDSRDRSRSPSRPKKSKGGFKWKEKAQRDDTAQEDTTRTTYRERSPKYDSKHRDRDRHRERSRERRRHSDRDRDYREDRYHDRNSDRRTRPDSDKDVESQAKEDPTPVAAAPIDPKSAAAKFGAKAARSRPAPPPSDSSTANGATNTAADTSAAAAPASAPAQPAKSKYKSTAPAEPMIIVNVNDRLGTKASIPCLASDPVKAFKAMVAARIGRQPHEIMLKRQGERPFKDQLTLEDYGVSNGVQLDLELDTGD